MGFESQQSLSFTRPCDYLCYRRDDVSRRGAVPSRDAEMQGTRHIWVDPLKPQARLEEGVKSGLP